LQQTSLKVVVIKADADVPYHYVVDLMDAAGGLGADITLAADLQQAMQQARP
jgi:biopolymer transport protein ExbD